MPLAARAKPDRRTSWLGRARIFSPHGAARTTASPCRAAPAQRIDLAGNAEEFDDEVFELGRKLDDEIGFRLAGELFRCRAGGHQPIVQVRVAAFKEIDEAAVETHQAVASVKVLEPQIKAKRQTFTHQRDVLNALDMRPTARALPDPQSGICCTRASKLRPGTARPPRPGSVCPSISPDPWGRARPIPAFRCLRPPVRRRSRCDAPRRNSSAGIR